MAVACSKPDTATSNPTAAAPAVAASQPPLQAKDIFATRCSTCHGVSGTGDGPASAALNPKPRNYTDKTWQASVNDEQIKKAIVGGGPAVGKSNLMPPNPDLEKRPEVVDDLVKIVRGFAK